MLARFLAIVTLGLVLSVCTVQAATVASEPVPEPVSAPVPVAMLKAEVKAPIWSNDPLVISFEPDKNACVAAFGANWREKCRFSADVTRGKARGVLLRPALKGNWRWYAEDAVAFVPEDGWPTDTPFSVSLEVLVQALGVQMAEPTVQVRTLPLAVLVDDGEFWGNPASGGKHSVSFGLRFTAPPDRGLVEKALTLKVSDAGLKLAAPAFIWLAEGTRCTVKAEVLALSREPASVTLRLPGVRELVNSKPKTPSDGRWYVSDKPVSRDRVIPGASTLFRPVRLELTTWRNASLETEYHLITRFSLRVKPEEVLRNLTVHELPLTRDAENIEPFNWSLAELVPADIAAARELKPELVTVPGESGDSVRFRVPATPGRHVAVTLRKGFGPSKESALASEYQVTGFARVPEAKVDFLQPGNVLPLGGAKVLDMVSHGLERIDWTVQRVLPDRLGAASLAWLFNTTDLHHAAIDDLSDAVSGRITLSPEGAKKGLLTPVFSTLDLEPLFRRAAEGASGSGGHNASATVSGLMMVELTGYREGKPTNTVRRLVLVTDLGLVLKKEATDQWRVFVGSLASGGPVEGVAVSIVGANGLPVAEAVTGADGSARLPSVQGLTREKEPRAVVARRTSTSTSTSTSGGGGHTDMAWLALDDADRRVDYSRFATGGQTSAASGLNAYVFGQRGVFRPGETLHFGYLLRRGDWQSLPSEMPLAVVLRDPAGRVVMRRAITVGDGLGECSWASADNAPTGFYRLAVTTPPASAGCELGRGLGEDELELGSAAVRIEEFQPETLTVKAELLAADELLAAKGWVRPDGAVQARVTLRNLYGLPATERKVRGRLNLVPASLHFKGFESYTFSDMLPWKGEHLNKELPEGLSDANGQATLPLGLEVYQNGTLQAFLFVEGFEPDGGRSVSAEQQFLVSPLPYMLGFRPEGATGSFDFLSKDSASGLEFVAVDAELARTDPGPLTFEVLERRYVTSLVSGTSGQLRYDETPIDTPVSTSTASIGTSEPYHWRFPTARPGEFLLTVRAGERVLARVPFTVAGNDDLRPALKGVNGLPPASLRVRLDKSDYNPGETVRVFVAAPYDGVGLLTLERDNVAAHAWFTAKAGHSVQTLTLPANFEGRGYINVSLARSLTSSDIFVQPHTFAMTQVTVNVQARNMGLRVQAPELVKPGVPLPVRVTAAKPGRVLVFAVDEGVLQLTRFITPDPLRYLLLDRALEVQTFQFLDRVMPDHNRLAKRMAAFGGGMNLFAPRNDNPFKRRAEPPLAWWSGIVEVGPEGIELAVPVPDYINSQIRVMAVGLSPDAVGSADAQTTVRAPILLAPQFPLLATPGDHFEVALAVTNGGNTPARVNLAVQADPALPLGNPLSQPLELAPGEERVVPFALDVGEPLGHAEAVFTATDDQGQTVSRKASLSVRPATLPAHSAWSGRAAASLELPVARQLYPFKATGSASVSAAPLPALRGILRYLHNHPYSCVEQSLSRALPLLLLYRQPELEAVLRTSNPATAATDRRTTLDLALARLRGAYDSREGVRPWAYAGGAGNLLLTAYAADWLLALREAGLGLPGELAPLFNTLDELTNNSPDTIYEARAHAYAIWVLTRAGFITTQKIELLGMMLTEGGFKADMAYGLMAGALAGLRLHDAAASALTRYTPLPVDLGREPLDAVAADALHVAVLARHFPDRLRSESEQLTARLLAGLNAPGGYTTFTAAQSARALLALQALVPVTGVTGASATTGGAKALAGVELVCTAPQPGFALPEAEPRAQPRPEQGLLVLDAPGCASYSLRLPAGSPPLYWEVEVDGYDRAPLASGHNCTPAGSEKVAGLDVSREMRTLDGTLIDPALPDAVVRQGELLRVEVRAALVSGQEAEVVLADLLPGGFEQVWRHEDNTLSSDEDRIDRHEDRMVMHTTLRDEAKTFVYVIRAVNRGQVTVPALRAEGLYNRALQGAGPSGTLTVK